MYLIIYYIRFQGMAYQLIEKKMQFQTKSVTPMHIECHNTSYLNNRKLVLCRFVPPAGRNGTHGVFSLINIW